VLHAQIHQVNGQAGGRFLPDDLDWYTGPDFADRQEMMPVLFGRRDLPYGEATAYLFRRFGYPERGWDPYKELISWTLTTPDPEIRLRITPYVGDDLSIAIRPLLSVERKRALDLWEGAPRAAWEDRFEAHLAGMLTHPLFLKNMDIFVNRPQNPRQSSKGYKRTVNHARHRRKCEK
jgi:hypothetical protein